MYASRVNTRRALAVAVLVASVLPGLVGCATATAKGKSQSGQPPAVSQPTIPPRDRYYDDPNQNVQSPADSGPHRGRQ